MWAVTTGKELQISPGDYEHDPLAISRLIPLHAKFLQFDWLRAVYFSLI